MTSEEAKDFKVSNSKTTRAREKAVEILKKTDTHNLCWAEYAVDDCILIKAITDTINTACREALDLAANNVCCVRYPEIPCPEIIRLKELYADGKKGK